jgi:hypothetical protein
LAIKPFISVKYVVLIKFINNSGWAILGQFDNKPGAIYSVAICYLLG